MKTRFSPSPTGLIHLGNARTALFSALAARGADGCFLLRIEDTDTERSQTEYTDALKTDLQWLHATWQEGPDVGGKHAPYFQSERGAIYNAYYDELQAKGLAYPCFCSEQELALSRKIQRSQGQAPRYTGKCRELSEADINEKLAAGLKPVLRFRVPKGDVLEFDDLVYGKQCFNGDDIGDFIIRRGNGGASFMFCNAIDDSLMGVTHALRGDDHLTNTPRQLWILRALNLPEPRYGHISLIVGADGSPLSKRHGSKSISELRTLGYLPLAVINYLARLGHYYADNQLLSFDDLARGFHFENLGRAPAKYDEQQLIYWQKQALQQLSDEALWQRFPDAVKHMIPTAKQHVFVTAIRSNIHFPHEAGMWAETVFTDALRYTDAVTQQLQQTPLGFYQQALELWQADCRAWLQALKTTTQTKGKQLFQPIRLALTGQSHGPDLPVLCNLLGEARIKQRLQTIISQWSQP